MTNEFKISSLHELDEKSLNYRNQFVHQNYKELYNIFTKNVNKKEFKHSRNAAFILVFFPGFVNLYYTFVSRNSIFKNSFRIAAVFGCILNFGYQLFTDLNEVGKTDTPEGNKIKKLYQNIAYNEPIAPNFGKETLKIYKEREIKGMTKEI